MKSCKKFRQNLMLYYADELTPLERAEVEVHLQACPACQAELAELKQLYAQVPQKPLIEPEESTLQVLRNVVSRRIQLQAQSAAGKDSKGFHWFHLRPVFQLGLATLLILLGFLLGQSIDFSATPTTSEMTLQKLLTLNQPVQFNQGAFDPYLGNIEKVKYDPASGTIEIFYQTINDIQLKGTLENPAVREILQQALVEETSPAVRLHAVKAIHAFTSTQQDLDPAIMKTLAALLKNEQNQGVRLQILKVLGKLPFTSEIKNILVRLLMYDENSAVRIEAFQILAAAKHEDQDLSNVLKSAQSDSNSYIRYSASKLLEQLQDNEPIHLGRTK